MTRYASINRERIFKSTFRVCLAFWHPTRMRFVRGILYTGVCAALQTPGYDLGRLRRQVRSF